MLAEPDGTFLPQDMAKLLVYSNECDVVFGTRTTRELIWADANMDWLLRWGNWAVAKLDRGPVQHQPPVATWAAPTGCCAARRPSTSPREMRVGGSHAGVEIMLLTITSGARYVEVPVNYLPRVGGSSVTGKRIEAIKVGLRMIALILRFRRGDAAPGRAAARLRGRAAGRRRGGP